ncbi:MAG: cbb3-type cytochrome oxidase assembly protein CcoS [Deltaproteobacteria bacterium]|nr:cbb3-type cytochrome oxidase assembly protein CcoS [Deltaproteobacteria bacterium]
MEMLFIMIPAAIFLGFIGLIFLIWSVKTGQFEDMEGPKYRIFFEDDEPDARSGRGERR